MNIQKSKFQKDHVSNKLTSMVKCRDCRETDNLSHYRVKVPIKSKGAMEMRDVMHCNKCGYSIVGDK